MERSDNLTIVTAIITSPYLRNLGFLAYSHGVKEALETNGLSPGLLGVHRPEDRPDNRPNDF